MSVKEQTAIDSTPDFLKADRATSRPGRRRRWTFIALVSLAIVASAFLFLGGKDTGGSYLTEDVVTGPLTVSISASGTLQPTRSVDVGSELSGTLEAVLVEENDRVTKGQVIARLETSKLRDAVEKSKAALAAAEAAVAQNTATLGEARANLDRLRHVAELSGGRVPSKTELATGEATYQRAVANLASARASVAQAKAMLKINSLARGFSGIRRKVIDALIALANAEVYPHIPLKGSVGASGDLAPLAHMSLVLLGESQARVRRLNIVAPSAGLVLERKVEPGQTVAAQMTTPVLYTIAEDLTKMELQVKVDEADVGSVQLGQPASFTVSAWAGRQFPATIQRVGLGSTTTDNVVTYKTVLSVANDDLALRPGMTATARIVTAKRDNALQVPNAALRFSPPNPKSEQGAQSSGSFLSRLVPRPPQPRKPKAQAAPAPGTDKQVWVLRDGQPVAVDVKTGASNGRQTEIVGGSLEPGMAVIVDYQDVAK